MTPPLKQLLRTDGDRSAFRHQGRPAWDYDGADLGAARDVSTESSPQLVRLRNVIRSPYYKFGWVGLYCS